MQVQLPTFSAEHQPCEFTLPGISEEYVILDPDGEEIIAEAFMQRPGGTHYVCTLPRSLSGRKVFVRIPNTSRRPNHQPPGPPATSPLQVTMTIYGESIEPRFERSISSHSRSDFCSTFSDRRRSIYSNVDLSVYDSKVDGFLVAIDVGYMRRQGEPWRILSDGIHYQMMVVSSSTPSVTVDQDGMSLIRSISVTPIDSARSRYMIDISLKEYTMVHGQRVGFIVGINMDPSVRSRVGICEDLLEAGMLSSMPVPAAKQIPRPTTLIRVIEDYERNPLTDYFATRVLEGNQYSAAPGSNWKNMGRRHIAPAIVGPQGVDDISLRYLDVMRSSAIGLSLLRIHNVVEEDGTPVRFENHTTLRTDRQIPHFSSGDFLLAGDPPPAGQPNSTNPEPQALGLDRRNARDGEHYEIGVVDDYLALVIDHSIERSRRTMLQMDFARTKIWNKWSATSRDAGREISQAADAFYLFSDLQPLLALYIDQWVQNTVRDSLTARDFFIAANSPNPNERRYLPARTHSKKNGKTWVAPYEEALLAGAMLKASAILPDSIAAYFAALLARSVLFSFQLKNDGSYTVSYLTEYQGGGLEPTEFSIGGSEYINFCMQAVRVYRRLRGLLPPSPDLNDKADDIVEKFMDEYPITEEAIRWFTV